MKVFNHLVTLVICALIFSSTVVYAGNGTHGGSAIACMNTKSVELLDYYEARLTTNLTIDVGPKSQNFLDNVKYVLDRLAKTDPVAADRYMSRAQTFIAETHFIGAEELKQIDDSNEAVAPSQGCIKQQFAVQLFNLKMDQVRYLVNRDLWNNSSSQTRAGLVLHEVILRDAVEVFGQTDSDSTRFFNMEISSTKFANMTNDVYRELLKSVQFVESGLFSIHRKILGLNNSDVLFDAMSDDGTVLRPVDFIFPDGQHAAIKSITCDSFSCKFLTDSQIVTTVFGFKVKLPFLNGSYVIEEYNNPLPLISKWILAETALSHTIPTAYLAKDTEIEFYPSGRVISGKLAQDLSLQVGSNIGILGQGTEINFSDSGQVIDGFLKYPVLTRIRERTFTFAAKEVYFYGSGHIESANLEGATKILMQGMNLETMPNSEINFYDSGEVRDFKLGTPASFSFTGKLYMAASEHWVHFYESEKVNSFSLLNGTSLLINGRNYQVNAGSSIAFYESGKPLALAPNAEFSISINGKVFDVEPNETIAFYESGRVGNLVHHGAFSLPIGKYIFDLSSKSKVYFYESGEPGGFDQGSYLDKPISYIYKIEGVPQYVTTGSSAGRSFFENGNVKRGRLTAGFQITRQNKVFKVLAGYYEITVDQGGNITSFVTPPSNGTLLDKKGSPHKLDGSDPYTVFYPFADNVGVRTDQDGYIVPFEDQEANNKR